MSMPAFQACKQICSQVTHHLGLLFTWTSRNKDWHQHARPCPLFKHANKFAHRWRIIHVCSSHGHRAIKTDTSIHVHAGLSSVQTYYQPNHRILNLILQTTPFQTMHHSHLLSGVRCTIKSDNNKKEKERENLRRQWRPLHTVIKEKEPLWYRVP